MASHARAAGPRRGARSHAAERWADDRWDHHDDTGADGTGDDETWDDEPTDPGLLRRLAAPPAPANTRWLLFAVAAGTLAAVGMGVYGRVHEPTFVAISVAGFSSGTAVKAWLGTAALALVLVQLLSAMALYGRLPGVTAGRLTVALHRWSGRVAVLLTVPVAVHCLYALGYQDTTPRVLVHSLAGCFFYGAFVAKMLVLGRADAPRWSLPLLGGAVFTGLTALWLTSSLWFFTTSGLTF